MTKYLNVSWEDFHSNTAKLAAQLKESDTQWDGIVAVTRGGLIPAAILAHEMDIKLIDTVCVASYDDDTKSQGELNVLKSINQSGKNLIVVDDLVDTGKTHQTLEKMLPEATMAVIYAKPMGKPRVDYSVEDVDQDCWIVFPWEESPAA